MGLRRSARGRGLNNPSGLKTLRGYFPGVPLVVDAGLGAPSHAAAAMELGYDAVLLNTAVAKAGDPRKMAVAFAKAVEAGRAAFEAGLMPRARHGGAFDAGRGNAVFRVRQCLIDFIPSFRMPPGSSASCRSASRRCNCASRTPAPTRSAREIARSLAVCAAHGCQLIVNDYWREAIDLRRRVRPSRPGGPRRGRSAPPSARPGSSSAFPPIRARSWRSRWRPTRIMSRSGRSTKRRSR